MDDEIPGVRQPGEGVGKNENGVPLVNGVTQKRQRPDEAQPPECLRHHHLLLFLGDIPLHQKARRKNEVTQPPDNFPNAPINAEQFAIVPDEVIPEELGQPIHNGRSLTQRRNAAKKNKPAGGDGARVDRWIVGWGGANHHPPVPQSIHPIVSSARDDFDNLQAVASLESAFGKFRWRNRLTVVLHHHTARQEFLRDEKFLNRARQPDLNRLAIGGDKILAHENRLSNSLCVPIQIHTIVSPKRTPTARYWSFTRTDQTSLWPRSFLKQSEGWFGVFSKYR